MSASVRRDGVVTSSDGTGALFVGDADVYGYCLDKLEEAVPDALSMVGLLPLLQPAHPNPDHRTGPLTPPPLLLYAPLTLRE